MPRGGTASLSAVRSHRTPHAWRLAPLAALAVVVAGVAVVGYFSVLLLDGVSAPGGGPCARLPCTVGLSAPTERSPAPGLQWAFLNIVATPGVTAGALALRLVGPSGAAGPSPGAAPNGSCRPVIALTAATCGLPADGAWYALLTGNSSGLVAAVYSNGSWSAPGLAVSASLVLVVVSASAAGLAGSGDLLVVVPSAGASVSGESGAF